MKKKKKIFIAVGVVAAVSIAAVAFMSSKKGPVAMPVQCTALKQTTLSSSVSTTGLVQSADTVNVYTDLNYNIQSLSVKVGDHVKAGDVLCQLNTQDLKDTIEQKQAALRSSAALSSLKIKTSEKKYNDNKSTLDAGLNAQINAAQEKVDSAKRDLESAQQKQSDAKKNIDENLNASLIAAKSSVASTKQAYDSAQLTYADTKKHKKNGDYDNLADYEIEDIVRKAREAVDSAQLTYDTALKNLYALGTESNEQLAQYVKATETAQVNYDSAVKSLKATQVSVDQDLKNDQQGINSDKISADDKASRAELQSLQAKLGKCTVTAPASGTITAVYAVKNAPANGLLFVIEDTNALKLSVKIKEYDISSVKVGMPAIIKADAISDKQYEGQLQKIAPTAVKGTDGKTASGSNAEFEADVVVSSRDTGLLIGMNARAEIILKKKESVFAVPYDAVTTDAEGKDIVFVAKAQKDGSYKAESIPVTLGLETDSQVEISGTGLGDGLQIISDGKQVTPGMTVQLAGEGT